MKKQIFIDIDGTVIDIKDRFYSVHCETCKELGIPYYDKDKFWEIRSIGLPAYSDYHKGDYIKIFNDIFEDPYYLSKDKIFPGMLNVIECIRNDYDIYFVTFRNKLMTLQYQLSSFGITESRCIITEKGHFDKRIVLNEKAIMISKHIKNPKGYIIGDTEYEIIAGKELGLKTISVLWGDRCKQFLDTFGPNYYAHKPEDIIGIIS